MGQLSKALAKEGVTIQKKEGAKAKSKTELVKCDPKTTASIDQFLKLSRDIKDLEAQLADHVTTIRTYGLARALEEKNADTVALQGKTGDVQLTIKEQFSIKTEAQYEQMKGLFGEDHVSQEDEISIDFSKMTPAEQKEMVKFIKKTFSAERAEKLVQEVPKFKTNKLKEYIFENAENEDQLADWRQISGHFSPTVVEYKKSNKE
jgi:hypothetical protein